MTEEPTWIAKVFGSDEAEIKGATGGATSGDDKTMSAIGDMLKSKGGAGKVVIIAKPEK
jgi:hypothetical protein